VIDPSYLVDDILRGVLGGRRKRSKKALRYLTKGGTKTLLSNPQVLWTAAGLAWGVIETLQNQGAPVRGAQGAPVGAGAPVPSAPPPPLPHVGPAVVPNEVLRLVRLAISAANADGTMGEQERAAVVREAEAHGGSELVAAELAQPRPVRDIVAGSTNTARTFTVRARSTHGTAVVHGDWRAPGRPGHSRRRGDEPAQRHRRRQHARVHVGTD
jgi:uncharacterized membrane protein YebE (DUF533 family)